MGKQPICVPLGVPQDVRLDYERNFPIITRGWNPLRRCTGDQKVGRFREDFHGAGIHMGDHEEEPLCRIDAGSVTGGFTTHTDFIVYCGMDYPQIHGGRSSGCARGGTVHQCSPCEIFRLHNAIVTLDNADSRINPGMYEGL